MVEKTKLLVLLLVFILSAGTVYSWNYDYGRISIDGLFYNLNKSDLTAEVSYQSYSNYVYNADCTITSVSIPNSVVYEGKTYRVTRIGDNAFKNCYSLESVSFGENIVHIGEQAFINCSSLKSIILPESLESFGRCAFQGCTSLRTVIIPDRVKTISAHAFNSCSSINSITIGKNVQSIEYKAFYGCKGLSSLVIPEGVLNIEYDAFKACSNLTSVTIPKSIISIGEYGSSDNYSAFNTNVVKTIYYTGNIADWCRKTWGPQYVSTNYKLYINGILQQNITLPDGITSIASSAFRGCKSLTHITLPNSIVSVRNGAFYDCADLASITIPANVDTLGNYVFKGCVSLTTVRWNVKKRMAEMSTPFYKKDDFNISKQIVSFTFGDEVEYIPPYLCQEMNKLTSIEIPNSVTFIQGGAFLNCSGLTSVTIPSGVAYIFRWAFKGCSRLKEINMLPETPPYEDDDIVDTRVPIYIPCGTLDAYLATKWSNYNIQYQPYPFKFNISSQEPYKGSVISQGGNTCENLSLSTVPNEGYYFVQWSDGITDNPRTIVVTKDTTISAIFGPFHVTFVDDNDTILSSQVYEYGAIPIYNGATPTKTEDETYTYTFKGWTPEIVPVMEDVTYTAMYTATKKTDAIDNVTDNTTIPIRYMDNGNIYILLPSGKKYSILGELVN